MQKKIELYTDGACSYNPGPGGWGVVLIYNEIVKELSGYESNTTNNRMELLAVIKGLEALKEKCSVSVFSDSQYTVDAFNKKWVQNWIKNNWRTSAKQEVKNIDLWQKLLVLCDYHDVMFHKVKGHSDNVYNNRCDELARSEIVKNT